MVMDSRVEVINLSGGLIGLLGTNPRKAINNKIEELSVAGWRCHQIIPYATRNTLALFFQALILLCTLGLWTFGAGYMLLMQREKS